MASNFWESSHFNEWIVDADVLPHTRTVDLKYLSPRLHSTLSIFFSNFIAKIGKKLGLRQIPIATANIYFKRFYLKNSWSETDPFLTAGCCVYVAAKVEETPIHIKSVVSETKNVCADVGYFSFASDHTRLAEMEFYLIEDLEFNLIVYHPYRSLGAITGKEPADAGKFPDDQAPVSEPGTDGTGKLGDEAGKKRSDKSQGKEREPLPERREGESELEWSKRVLNRGTGSGLVDVPNTVVEMAWSILNDSLRTDVCLLYPPYVIAIAALFLASALQRQDPPDPPPGFSGLADDLVASLLAASHANNPDISSETSFDAAKFLSQFQVSLPAVLSCAKQILAVYPLWDDLDNAARLLANVSKPNRTASLMRMRLKIMEAAYAVVNKPPALSEKDMVTLVQKIQLERAVDVGHPSDAGAPPTHQPVQGQAAATNLLGSTAIKNSMKRGL